MNSFIVLGIVLFGIILVASVILSMWKKVQQGQAGVVTGLKKRVISGGGGLVIPLFERIDYISLENIKLDVGTKGAMTSKGVPLNTNGVAIIKIKNDEESILAAMEQFNSNNQDSITIIKETTKDVLEGKLREIVSKMTVEEIHSDRESFISKVQEVAATDLLQMGLELKTLTIRDIDDEHGYLKAMGETQIAEKKKTTTIAVAQANKETQVAVAEAAKETQIMTSESTRIGEEAKIKSQISIAEAKKNQTLKELAYEEEEQKAKATKDASYSIQENITQKQVTDTQMDAEVLRQKRLKDVKEEEIQILILQEEKNIELAQKKAERKEKELQETQIKPAEAMKEQQKLQAEAKKHQEIAQAEAEAQSIRLKAQAESESIRLKAQAEAEALREKGLAEATLIKEKGLAEAQSIREQGLAEADAMKEKAEAMKQYGDAAKLQIMAEILPQMAKHIAEPMGNIDKIVCIGGNSDSEGGASSIAKTVAQTMTTVFESVEQTTGFDMLEVMKANTYDAKVNKNITLNGNNAEEIVSTVENIVNK